MRNKIIVMFLFITTFIVGQNLELKFEIEKAEYLQYEPINGILRIKNIGNEKIMTTPFTSYNECIKVNIINKNDEVVKPYSDVVAIAHGQPVYDLMSGEEIFGRIDLMNYGNSYGKTIRFGTYFSPGEYTINFIYTYYSGITNKETIVISNKQTIKINNLAKDDEKIISDLEKIIVLEGRERVKKAIEVVNKYQHHPLTKQAFMYMDQQAVGYYDFDRTKYMKIFCLNFPNSFRAVDYASQFIEEYPKFKEKILGTKLYQKAIAMKKDKKKMRKILERNPYNERILKEIKKRELQKAGRQQNEK